jgi:nucleoside-diphosphate-sugar epimerase
VRCRRQGRNVAHLSSAAVVGDPGDRVVSTTTRANPTTSYGRSKLEGELLARELLSSTHVRLRVFRPPMVYGPGMRGNPLRLFDLVDRGVPLPLGSLRNRRSILGIQNLVDAIECAIELEARIESPLYLADEMSPTTPELVRAIAFALRRPARLVSAPQWLLAGGARLIESAGPLLPVGVRARAEDIRRLTSSFVVDTSEARSALGFVPRVSLAEGLAEAADWWRTGRADVWP